MDEYTNPNEKLAELELRAQLIRDRQLREVLKTGEGSAELKFDIEVGDTVLITEGGRRGSFAEVASLHPAGEGLMLKVGGFGHLLYYRWAEVINWVIDQEPNFQQFESGAVRDTQEGKTRYDLIDPTFLRRMADVMLEGASHYGEFNWTKGIPSQRYAASLLRHVFAYLSGDRSEDHLGRAAFNLQGLARNEGTNLDDLFDWSKRD